MTMTIISAEFSSICDDKARYFVESAPNGTIYLTAK
jgi:hypothetical protein